MQLGHAFSHFQCSKLIEIGAAIPQSLIEKSVCMLFWYGQIFSKQPEFCLYVIDSAIQQIWQSNSINKQ